MSAATTTTIEEALRLLHEPGEVFEVRIFGVKGAGTVSGYFNDPALAAAAIAGYDGDAEGIYHTINPVNPALLERAPNRLREHVKKGESTSDKDILWRRWLPIDLDYSRPAKTNATVEELKAACSVGKQIRARLEDDLGYPAAVRVMSGNGVHLLHRIDLPPDSESRALVTRVLKELAKDFDVPGGAHVDTSVHNAARIMKVPGTMVRKGPHSEERPHRRSHLIGTPGDVSCVPQSALETFAAPVPVLTPEQQSSTGNGKTPWTAKDVEDHLTAWGLELRGHKVTAGEDLWELKVCPFNPEHDRGEAFVTRDAAGRLLAGCHHNSCTWRWGELREKYEPEHGYPDDRSAPHVIPVDEHGTPIADEKLPVRVFYPAPDLRDYVSPDIDWVIEKLLAKGVFTIFGGKPKAGKTTFAFGAVYAMQTGCSFMGMEVRKAPVLYITEQNKTTIRPKLDEYGLLDCTDVHLMFPRQMLGMAWEDIIDQAATYCEQHGIDVVIVDTVNDLCHLENSFSDTEWIAALDPLQRLATHGHMAVFASLHAKKEAASLVDMFRGSNAIVGKADIVLGLWRDGSGDETTRTVEGMSRLDNGFDDRTRIAREGRQYMTAGTVKEMQLETRLQEYMDLLPTCREDAMTRQEIATKLEVTPGTVTSYITKLIAAGKVSSDVKLGRGNTRMYWAREQA